MKHVGGLKLGKRSNPEENEAFMILTTTHIILSSPKFQLGFAIIVAQIV